ncbi:MAG: hypothetical protein M1839_001291 [Geoglossum umbratile]|nr:MAG: hypothetical protein M1839_001291 [Geoglossum umbratile]
MTFGYDANVLTDTSNGRIAEFSENLLGGLAGERSQSWEKARPLIFICHSMGGIVVKRALVVAHARKRFHGSTGDATRSIVFMATPHRGSGKAYWGEMGRRLSSLLRGAPPGTSTLEEIRAFSAVLEDINADFTNIASAYNLVWFYKTIVEKWSAIMEHVNERNRIGVSANHRDIGRFDKED